MSTYTHDPDAVLDYAFDWSAWLAASETIASFTVTVPDGLELDSSDEATGIVTAWLSGGDDGSAYSVTCHIVTNQGREDDRTIRLRVRER